MTQAATARVIFFGFINLPSFRYLVLTVHIFSHLVC